MFELKQNKTLRLIKKTTKNKKETIFALIVFLVFLFTVLIYWKNTVITDQDVPIYSVLVANPYEKYERLVSGTNLKELIDNEHFIGMRHKDNLIKKEIPERKENIFLEFFQ